MTRNQSAIVWLVGTVLVVAPAPVLAENADANALQAGAAKIDVTPAIGHPMWGYAARHDEPCLGVLDRLHARAVVLSCNSEKISVVSLDLGRAPTRDVTARIRKAVADKAGIKHLFLVASHTHHGPVLELDTWPTRDKPYVRELERKIVQVILAADKNRKPARIKIAAKQVDLNRNRHSKRKNAPVDRELLVARIESDNGTSIAHIVSFAAHATMRPAKLRKFSADWPGALATKVEKKTGVPCLFLQGAAGDLSPIPRKTSGADAFGHAVADEVLALLDQGKMPTMSIRSIQAREDDFKFRSRVDFSNVFVKLAFARAFFTELVLFYEREYREGVRPHLTTVLLGDKVGIVGASGEFFCEHSLSLKRRARLDHVFFLGYCNDYQQYFPTIEAAGEGGYGADPTMSPVEVGAGEQMINRALIHLYKMRGKMPSLPPGKP